MLVPTVFAFIDKGAEGYPLYVKKAMVDAEVIWRYYHDDDTRVLTAMKEVFKIPRKSPTFYGVYAEYLVNPRTKQVEHGSDCTFEEFMSTVTARRDQLAASDGGCMIVAV